MQREQCINTLINLWYFRLTINFAIGPQIRFGVQTQATHIYMAQPTATIDISTFECEIVPFRNKNSKQFKTRKITCFAWDFPIQAETPHKLCPLNCWQCKWSAGAKASAFKSTTKMQTPNELQIYFPFQCCFEWKKNPFFLFLKMQTRAA